MTLQKAVYFFFLITVTINVCAQSTQIKNAGPDKYKTVTAGKQYKKGTIYRFFWGNNNRNTWTTPVTVPVLWLDTAKGGLKPVKEGGGHQTKSLRLKDKDGKEYAVRSISKSLGAVLPPDFKGTFLEARVNDEVSMSNPYGALIVPVLAESAHVYHTNPQLVYLPKQSLLDTFNNKYGDKFYLFEQKPNGDWSNADNLGNFHEYFSTEDVIKKLLENNKYKIDQAAFIRARIFDWFINDWDRHEGQWDWGERKINDTTFFVPVPEDRDQAFSTHDGFLLGRALAANSLFYMQSFKNNLRSIKKFNYEERNLDRLFTNEMMLDVWQNTAAALQQSLTDNVIDKAVKQLPPEVYKISGAGIAAKLRARRAHLAEWATTYYNFISEEIQVAGTKKGGRFNVQHLNDSETSVKTYDVSKENDSAYYSRVINSNQTKEIRLFGIDGSDAYYMNGKSNNLTIKAIGGAQPDSFINENAGRFYVYDDHNNFINKNASTKLKLSNDSSIHDFNYNWYKYDKGHMKPSLFYSFYDRIYVGFGYQYIYNKWRKEPFASKQLFDVHYSFTQKAFSYTYSALFPKLIGKADLFLYANYDLIRWIRFWGLGNETQYVPKDINYFTTSSRQWIFQPGVIRQYGLSTITASAFVQGVKIINDTSKFISKIFITDPQDYKWKTFAGAELNYKFQKLNDSVTPTKGFIFFADATGAKNINNSNSYFVKYSGNMQVYVPLFTKFSYVLRAGAATVSGKPEFYQYNSIGGAPNLRGFRRDRYWGKTAFWNMNDLRFISNIKSYIYNGKAGLIAFFDDGRVWLPGEKSNLLHTDFGGGIILAPFNKILADITYGISKDDKVINVRINKYF